MPHSADDAIWEYIYNTSSYSYERVLMNTAEIGTSLNNQDLYVYAWSSYNAMGGYGNGFSFYRYDSGTGLETHKGYVKIPKEKEYNEVGIIQDDGKNVYVIVLYNGEVYDEEVMSYHKGTFYDLYQWNATNMTSVSEYNNINSHFGLAEGSKGYRVSMDCHNLKKVVFCWEERDIAGNPGGIILRTMQLQGYTAPPFETSTNIAIAGVTGEEHFPDVSFGENGTKVRVVYLSDYLSLPGYKTIHINSTDYSSFTSYSTTSSLVAPTFPYFMIDYSATNYVQPLPFHPGDQLSIDCPDFDPGPDLWSVIVYKNLNNISSLTKTPSSTIVTKNLTTSISTWNNINPVVSYQTNEESGINYGWYCDNRKEYLATQLKIDGLTYKNPVSATSFFVMNNTLVHGLFNGALPTFSRTNKGTKGLLSAYPVRDPYNSLLEMRSKIIQYPIFHYRPTLTPNEVTVSSSPNPFSDYLQVVINGYNNEIINWELIDMQGKEVTAGKDMSLSALNTNINVKAQSLPSGNYILSISMNSMKYILKITKN